MPQCHGRCQRHSSCRHRRLPRNSTVSSSSDDHGEVLRPAKLWNDTESAPDTEELLNELPGGRAAWAEACGSVPVSSLHREQTPLVAALRA